MTTGPSGSSASQPRVLPDRTWRRLAHYRPTPSPAVGRVLASDRLVLGGLLLIAGLVRLAGLAGRGQFDADQGTEMHALMAIVAGQGLPLVGPGASVGSFHQGVLYYWLMAPFAGLSGGDPIGVAAVLTALGIVAVGLTWWLGRSIGGPTAGALAGLLMALSPAAIYTSTALWSASPLPFCGALAFTAAWQARSSGQARWWVVALGGAGAAWQFHLLGVLVFVPVVSLMAAEWLRAGRPGAHTTRLRLARAAAAGLAVVALLFAPLIVHELTTGFSESRLILAYLTGGAEPGRLGLAARLPTIVLRTLSWPFSGVLTEAVFLSLIAFSAVLLSMAAALLLSRREDRAGPAWLLATIAWSVIALAVAAPSLAVFVAALPNDHYHSFLVPVVIAATAVGMTRINRRSRLLGTVLIVVLIAIQVVRTPALVHPEGGWPAAREAGAQVVALAAGEPVAVLSVPDFKPPTTLTYPIAYAGGTLVEADQAGKLVVVCDRVFEVTLGATCGGPAEEAALARSMPAERPRLVSRFDASSRTVVSVYER